MKKVRKLFALVVAAGMLLAMSVTAFAQNVDSNAGGNARITIRNASKGEKYSVYKLFNASVTGTEGGSIAYTGDIPESLKAYFTQDTVGNISLKDNVDETNLVNALTNWAQGQSTATASVLSNGSTLTFTKLQYGYYVVTTTQGAAVTVTSTNPDATIVDKNSTTPGDLNKKVDNNDVNIGDTVTYTATFKTANYDGEGETAKQITSYVITDTLPEFLSNVKVTKITIGGADYKVDEAVPQFTDKKITIPWVDDNNNSLYNNGAEIVITYTATVADKAAIDGNGNTNKVTVTWMTGDQPGTDELTDTETICTYAIALKKVDQNGKPLAGAEFQFPFYVKKTADNDGAYVYAGMKAGEGLTNTITTPENGLIVVKGVKSGEYSITETKAPAGYNKLTEPVTVTAVKTGETTTKTTIYLDKDGKITDTETETKVEVNLKNISAAVAVVVNKTGSLLPSTGGMGTTIFYILGAVLVIGAGVLLVVRRRVRMSK